MSKQIAVRLPDDLATFVDAEVKSGHAPSRAAVVAKALERERRQRLAEQDIAILKAQRGDSDLDGLARHVARIPLDL